MGEKQSRALACKTHDLRSENVKGLSLVTSGDLDEEMVKRYTAAKEGLQAAAGEQPPELRPDLATGGAWGGSSGMQSPHTLLGSGLHRALRAVPRAPHHRVQPGALVVLAGPSDLVVQLGVEACVAVNTCCGIAAPTMMVATPRYRRPGASKAPYRGGS
eukprot:CAMPEP_0206420364 /NCGR_PEP_ID=MMETSP0324_2-20121206/792_1 /ASSEMBLY_ACC=CAM_ASM_000836 /TAXON_ID=2866 /ORGANISM="Crypthecodinium cohnii, Strain Seligo" /LENGTH=158 /DNA_ID=CAMNT_0053884221 /DNA_START=182 /DNA_END=660 /DNA_ORIENTATION=-